MEPFVNCHTEVCLRISCLRAVFSESDKKFRGQNLKILPQMSFDLNDLERPKWEFQKISWDNSVSPIDTKNNIVVCGG